MEIIQSKSYFKQFTKDRLRLLFVFSIWAQQRSNYKPTALGQDNGGLQLMQSCSGAHNKIYFIDQAF